jgi:hypothetical protein
MVVLLIIWWIIGSAILAVPVYIAAKIVKVNLDGYGWAFIATLLVSIVQTAVANFVPEAIFGLPIAILASILILSVTLGATLPKASLILVILAIMFVIFGFVAIELGGRTTLNFYGHAYSFSKDGSYSVDTEGGHTEINSSDGRHFSGDVVDGKPNGQGTLTSFDGTYAGEFRDGLLNGQGTETWNDGTKYVGEFRNGKRDAQGTETLPNG